MAAAILDILQESGVHVTFFVTGKWAEENPELVRRIAAEGHQVGNHTYSHPRLPELDEAALQDEVLRAEQILCDLSGQTTRPFLRPPYGSRNTAVLDWLAQHGYISIYWTLDSLDSIPPAKTAAYLVDRVTHPTDHQGNPVPLDGMIVLMHVGNPTTAEALPEILAWLREEGYQVVPVSEILRPQ